MTEGVLGSHSDVRPEASVTTAQRVAGAVLLVNAGFVLAETVLFPVDPSLPNPVLPTAFDVVLGGLLLARKPGVVAWVKVRLVLGAILFTGLHVLRGDPVMAGVQLAFSGGVAALMFGNPGKPRFVMALTILALLLALEVIGVQQELTGRNAIASLAMRLRGELEPLEGAVVVGPAFSFAHPGAGWQRRSEKFARADNPLADPWLIQPEYDAHLLVVAEEVGEPVVFPLDQLHTNVFDHAKKAYTNFEIRSETPIEAGAGYAKLVEATAVVEGTKLRFYYGLYTFEGHVFQLIAFAKEQSFRHVRAGLRSAVLSFAFQPQP